MTDIRHTSGKRDNQFLFEIRLNWLTANKGILTSNDVKDTIRVALPPAFGGDKDQWSPEHLFLGSVSSCFMTTYLVFAKKLGFEISHFECHTIGHIEVIEGKYEFTTVHLYPKIYIDNESFREKAVTALDKTKKYCLISNSVKSQIIYHPEISNETHIRFDKAMEAGTIETN